jgi:hypothetical protein
MTSQNTPLNVDLVPVNREYSSEDGGER